MRVITGKFKGRKLKAPNGLDVRPTSDRVKESIFNILRNIPENSKVLDLFAGTGNIGIEFLSRGADECFFIDNDNVSINIIRENLEHIGLLQQTYIYKNSAEDAIMILSKKGLKFDYIFIDPPYGKNLVLPSLEKICNEKITKKDGLVIIEHERKISLPDKLLCLEKIDFREYGGTTVTFYRNKEE